MSTRMELVAGVAAPPSNGHKHLVVTVHGIRTFGDWQDRLYYLLNEASSGSTKVHSYRYGYFSAIAFMIPFLRWIVTRRFRKTLLETIKSWPWERVDIVAHSFGTHMVAWGLRGIESRQRPRIHTIVFAGSVLKPTFPWGELMPECVHRLVNDCGTRDFILVLNQVVVLLTGMAGRIGFTGMNHDCFRNRFFRLGHSGYFIGSDGRPSDAFMSRNWLPLLLNENPAGVVDERPSVTALHGFAETILRNLEPIKLVVASASVLLVIGWLYKQWDTAEEQRLFAQDRQRAADVARDDEKRARRLAQDRLADSVLREAEGLRAAGRWTQSRERYLEAGSLLAELSRPRFVADLGLLDTYRQSPQPLIEFELPESWITCGAVSPDSAMGFFGTKAAQSGIARDLKTGSIAEIMGRLAKAEEGTGHEGRIIDLRTGLQLKALRASSRLTNARFSHDGAFVVFGCSDGSVTVWQPSEGRTWRFAAPGSHPAVSSIVVTPSTTGDFVTGHEDGTCVVWDWNAVVKARTFRAHQGKVSALEFTNRGVLLSSGADGLLKAWDAEQWTEIGSPTRHSPPVLKIAAGLGSEFTATGCGEFKALGTAELLRPDAGSPRFSTEQSSVAVSAKGFGAKERVFEKTIDVAELPHGIELFHARGEKHDASAGLVFSRDCRVLVALDYTGGVTVWPVALATDSTDLAVPDALQELTLSPDGLLAAVPSSKEVRLWDVQTGQLVRSFKVARADAICATFVETGSALVVGCGSVFATVEARLGGHVAGALEVFDVATGDVRQPSSPVGAAVTCIAAIGDRSRFVTGGTDGRVRAWDLGRSSPLWESKPYSAAITSVVLAPKGELVLAGMAGLPSQFVVLDESTGEEIARTEMSSWASCVAFEDGDRALLSIEGQLLLWSFRSSEPPHPIGGLGRRLRGIASFADARLVLTSADDQMLRLWDLETRRELAAYPLRGCVGAGRVVVSRDQRTILPGNGTLRRLTVWNLDRPAQLRDAERRVFAARELLKSKPDDPQSQRELGDWYALWGMWDWAYHFYCRARAAGVDVSALAMARCCWQADRIDEAVREFMSARAKGEAPTAYLDLLIASLKKPKR